MKKINYVVFLLLLTFLAACGSNDEDASEASKEAKAAEETSSNEEKGVEVDKNLLSVEVTLPASLYEGEEAEEVVAEAEKDGAKVTPNEDGSYTFKMSKSDHKKMMDEMSTEIGSSVDELVTSGDYTSFQDIQYNDDFSKFKVIVDKEAYENSMDAFASFSLGIAGMMYQLFDGADPDEYSVTITIEDEASGDVLDEVVYPDAMEDANTE
ncbi:FctA domain-containing protein [Terribacillus saccharophilus]|uniref:Spy0128 family protein n=1 Tax=Terribacillus saccharophilus TaxID=361277 RepID=UPI0039826B16